MWNKIAKAIRMRDKFKCYKCLYTAKDIPVHHIIPVVDGGQDNPNNLICLCPSHHKTTDNDFLNLGRTNYVKQMQDCARFRTMISDRDTKKISNINFGMGTTNSTIHRETTEGKVF